MREIYISAFKKFYISPRKYYRAKKISQVTTFDENLTLDHLHFSFFDVELLYTCATILGCMTSPKIYRLPDFVKKRASL